MKILVATQNQGKAKEIERILGSLNVEVVTLKDFQYLPVFEEKGRTFAENARGKARFYNRLTGLPTLGDDSGLVVDALDGAPGVRSARFAGEDASDDEKIEKLLSELKKVESKNRTAHFVCSISFFIENIEVITVESKCDGEIIDSPKGKLGFGYDPVFLVPSIGKTFAELSPEKKNSLSHRGKALTLFAKRFRELFGNDHS